MDESAPIGVFDSGLGGLTVVRRLLERMPAEGIVYYADTGYVPYGPRPLEQIRRFACEICDFLAGQGCKMIVMGCNMSSAVALETVRERLEIPVLGTIAAGVEGALQVTRTGRIGVAATEGTVASGMFPKALKQRRADIEVFQQACPDFVPIIETGSLDGQVAPHVAHQLAPLREASVDTLILGCTHYPLIINEIQAGMGPDVTIVDPAVQLARQTEDILRACRLLREASAPVQHRFFCSGDPNVFRRGALAVADVPVDRVEHVDVHSRGHAAEEKRGVDG